jgi:bacteriocin biosynthesis cyclodehydratase domain-containing protein
MLNQPTFKPLYSVATIEPEQIFLLSERDTVLLSDRFSYRIAALLEQQSYTVEEILDIIQLELLQQISPDKTEFFQSVLDVSVKTQYALFQLEQQGYLVEQDDSLPSQLAIFCHHLHLTPLVAAQRLQSTKVAVKALGSFPTADFTDLLTSLHIQVADVGDITVILTDDYLNPELAEFNQQALASQSPWMLVNPLGTILWIGPIFQPQQTGCWECLASRLRDNRPVTRYLQTHKQTSLSPPLGFLPSTVQTGLGMAATELFKWIIQGQNQRLAGKIITYDTLTLQTQDHTIIKRPQCPSCGELQGKENIPRPVVLGHGKKAFTADGGHRYCSPQETLSRYQHHISPITGVIRELRKIPGNGLTHTYIAKHHFLSVFDNIEGLRQNLGGRSGGKGRTDTQARASGFCEAIERYSGVFQGNEIIHKGSYQQLGDKAIHPNACMNFSPEQYQNREEWNGQCQGWFQKVPEPFDEDRKIDWTPVWSLTHQEFKYLPTAYCYYGYSPPYKPDCWADSNGCAAGNTIEEAILQAFMELVERDSVALWWYNRISRPAVDLDSFDVAYFQELKQYYQSLDRELWVLDISSDLNIPTFAAITHRKNRTVEDIVLGYGTHFDPVIAISRALTEVNQILPNVLPCTPDGQTIYPQSGDRLAIEWWQSATMANQPYLLPDQQSNTKLYRDYPQIDHDDLLADVKLCQQIVEQKGLEMLVLDQTRPDVGLRVAKVIIPGMRHMWRRLGSGRLYDVPVQMGWLQQPLTQDQLNPYPMWM